MRAGFEDLRAVLSLKGGWSRVRPPPRFGWRRYSHWSSVHLDDTPDDKQYTATGTRSQGGARYRIGDDVPPPGGLLRTRPRLAQRLVLRFRRAVDLPAVLGVAALLLALAVVHALPPGSWRMRLGIEVALILCVLVFIFWYSLVVTGSYGSPVAALLRVAATLGYVFSLIKSVCLLDISKAHDYFSSFQSVGKRQHSAIALLRYMQCCKSHYLQLVGTTDQSEGKTESEPKTSLDEPLAQQRTYLQHVPQRASGNMLPLLHTNV